MDTLFHFVFPIIAALAARIHVKHPVKIILSTALLAVLIDLDHFIFLERATFHNVFITILLPFLLIFLSFHFKTKYFIKGFFILLLLFLSSHTFLDTFTGGVALLYPLSEQYYSINFALTIPLESKFSPYLIEGVIVSSLGLGIFLYFLVIILPCLFLDEIIEKMEEKHEDFLKAFKDLLKS